MKEMPEKICVNNTRKWILLWMMALMMTVSMVVWAEAAPAEKLKISNKRITLQAGSEFTIKVQSYKGKKAVKTIVDWSSSNLSVVSVEVKSRTKAVLHAHSAGYATVRATALNGKSVTCKVYVADKAIRLALAELSWTTNASDLCSSFTSRGYSVTILRSIDQLDPTQYDGLLIPGGEDVNPNRYGETFNGSFRPNDAKDLLQIMAVWKFAKAGKPIFGVCRGCQIINVAFGGTLYQNIGGHSATIRIIKNLDGTCVKAVMGEKSELIHFHHQAVKKLADSFIVTQRDAVDGMIEGIYSAKYHAYGYQWHPELTGPGAGGVFEVFLQACKAAR